MNDMDAKLWSRLPSEVVETTLSFLSVPVLCRFRTVCKNWNSIICNPKFGALCIRHARQDASFLVARSLNIDEGIFKSDTQNHGWIFLDLKARRWYFITDPIDALHPGYRSVAMDGGLVCESLQNMENAPIFVSNPVAKISKLLPPSPYPLYRLSTHLDMIVDNNAHNFKIFKNGFYKGRDKRPSMIIYESLTNQWRISASIPPMPHVTWISVILTALFDGLLYVWVYADEGAHIRLWCYNHVDDTWHDTGVITDLRLFYAPQFIVTDNRLFLAAMVLTYSETAIDVHDDEVFERSYEIREINLESRTLNTVFRMTTAIMAQVFDVSEKDDLVSCDRILHAVGFRRSIILLCKKSGVTIVYDLSTCSLDLLPRNPLNKEVGRFQPIPQLYFGIKAMNLILPASDLWMK